MIELTYSSIGSLSLTGGDEAGTVSSAGHRVLHVCVNGVQIP